MIASIVYFWEKFESISDAISTMIRQPGSFDNVKYLYDEVIKHGLAVKT